MVDRGATAPAAPVPVTGALVIAAAVALTVVMTVVAGWHFAVRFSACGLFVAGMAAEIFSGNSK